MSVTSVLRGTAWRQARALPMGPSGRVRQELTLLLVAFIESDVVIKLVADLFKELVQTARVRGETPMLRVHGHDGQMSETSCTESR